MRPFCVPAELLRAAFLVVSPQGEVRDANSPAVRLLGGRREGIIGKPLAAFIADDAQALRELLRRGARSRSFSPGALTIVTASGERLACRCDCALFGEGGDGGGHAVLLRLAPRQEAAREFIAVREKIRELTREVAARKSAEAALLESDRRKDEFISMLAHELRNPLAPIRSGIEVLRRRNDPATTARMTEMMGRQVSHMVRLVDDLLDVSRLTRGRIEMRKEPALVADVVRWAEEMMRSQFDEAGVALGIVEPVPHAAVLGDATRLVQVLANLLANSLKFSTRGQRVTLSCAVHAAEVELHVADEGAGIAPEDLPRLFELFYQGRLAPGRAHGGLGVGLSICRYIVAMHGGSLEAHSEGLGHGSRFTMRLPLAGQAAPAAEP